MFTFSQTPFSTSHFTPNSHFRSSTSLPATEQVASLVLLHNRQWCYLQLQLDALAAPSIALGTRMGLRFWENQKQVWSPSLNTEKYAIITQILVMILDGRVIVSRVAIHGGGEGWLSAFKNGFNSHSEIITIRLKLLNLPQNRIFVPEELSTKVQEEKESSFLFLFKLYFGMCLLKINFFFLSYVHWC